MEPLSDPLRHALEDLRLATAADLRRCRRRVRTLARDLPAFDSIWLDALVQASRLSPFQANVLEVGEPAELALGGCVLIDRLGGSPHATTFLARERDTSRRVVLKRIGSPPESRDHGVTLSGLQSLAAALAERRLAGCAAVVGPHAALDTGTTFVTLSRFVAGPTLRELLTRRGRFPAPVVEAIGRQLAEGLSALEATGLCHGDVRLGNVRLTDAGQAVLVDAGVRPVIEPELAIPQTLDPDRFDGTAPELIGTGRTLDATADAYALGCLLWHLLAGRPPFPTGDPLARLVAHQTQRVPDIRLIAPDTPAALAELVERLTDPEPTNRPPLATVRQHWGRSAHRSRRRLAAFRRGFNIAVRRAASASTSRGTRAAQVVTLLCVLIGSSILLLDAGARNELLAIPHRLRNSRVESGSESGPSAEPDATTNTIDTADPPAPAATATTPPATPTRPLPEPDAGGVITLTAGPPYAVQSLTAVGSLTIRGPSDEPACLLVSEPVRIIAEELRLENLVIRQSAERTEATDESAAIHVESQRLSVSRSRIEYNDFDDLDGDDDYDVLAWRPLDRGDPDTAVLIEDAALRGGRAGIRLDGLPRALRLTNCLRCGGDSCITLRPGRATPQELRIELQCVTVRGTASVVAWQRERIGALIVSAEDCIFDIPDAFERPAGSSGHALLRLPDESAAEVVSVTGRGTLLSTGRPIAVAPGKPPGTWRELDDTRIPVEGLAFGEFEFVGPPPGPLTNSGLTSWQGPRLGTTRPGFDPHRLAPNRKTAAKQAAPGSPPLNSPE